MLPGRWGPIQADSARWQGGLARLFGRLCAVGGVLRKAFFLAFLLAVRHTHTHAALLGGEERSVRGVGACGRGW